MKKKLIVLAGLLTGFAPVVALAQVQVIGNTCSNVAATVGTIEGALCRIGNILNLIIPVLITLGVVYFIWGVITYVISSDEEAKKSGRNRMIYGVIGLAVIVAVWGLVNLLTRTFGVDNQNSTITLPTIQ